MSRPGRILMLALLWLAPGCTSLVRPPAPAPSGKSEAVFLVNYSHHTSLIVPAREGRFDEYAYGDWPWFAEGKKNSPSAVRALFASCKSGLGRRQLEFDVTPSARSVADATEAKDVIQLNVPAEVVRCFAARMDRE